MSPQWAACPPACTMWPLAAKGPFSSPFKWKRPCWKLAHCNRHWLVVRPKFSTSHRNLSGITENRNTLFPRQLSRLQNVMAVFSRKRCTNCGSGSHNTHEKSCPARGVQCRSCGKANHFAKWCRSKPAAVKQVAQDPKKEVKVLYCSWNMCRNSWVLTSASALHGSWWSSRYRTHEAEMQRGSLVAEDEHSRGAVGPRVWSLRTKRKVS